MSTFKTREGVVTPNGRTTTLRVPLNEWTIDNTKNSPPHALAAERHSTTPKLKKTGFKRLTTHMGGGRRVSTCIARLRLLKGLLREIQHTERKNAVPGIYITGDQERAISSPVPAPPILPAPRPAGRPPPPPVSLRSRHRASPLPSQRRRGRRGRG